MPDSVSTSPAALTAATSVDRFGVASAIWAIVWEEVIADVVGVVDAGAIVVGDDVELELQAATSSPAATTDASSVALRNFMGSPSEVRT